MNVTPKVLIFIIKGKKLSHKCEKEINARQDPNW